MAKRFHYGGQAVIEGVMMRGPKRMKVAVRRSNGEIVSLTESLGAIYSGSLRIKPLLRGLIVLIETVVLGVKALLYSARITAELELDKELNPIILWIPVAIGIIFGVALFVVVPLSVTHFGLDRFITSSFLSNAVDGFIRVAIFVAYLKVINLMPDIRRIFAYHGAEHKTVNAYEAGVPLEVEEIQKYSTAHTRCGTSFLLIVLVIAIIAFVFLGRPDLWIRFLSRLALLPMITGIGYEILRFSADHAENAIVRLILAPGLALQSLTTRQPDARQIEMAIEALEGVQEPEAVDEVA